MLPSSARVAVGSTNSAKLAAVEAAFAALGCSAAVVGVAVDSGVSAQPTSAEETMQGASNRCAAARSGLDAEFYLGCESGLFVAAGVWVEAGWCVVEDAAGVRSVGASPVFPLPDRALPFIESGLDLDEAMEAIAAGAQLAGSSGFYDYMTAGALDRREANRLGVLTALSRWVRPELW